MKKKPWSLKESLQGHKTSAPNNKVVFEIIGLERRIEAVLVKVNILKNIPVIDQATSDAWRRFNNSKS